MNKQRPSNLAIFTMFAFTASCVGLLIFLWLSFGGTLPLAPQGYRVSVEFDQGVELASQAQVQISGVPVGRVVSVGLDHRTGLSRAVMEIDKQYAPRPVDTHAILRAKTLLGETYVELSPGTPAAPKIPDGGTIPQAQVSPTVQLDQIFSTFDPATRQAFQTWMQQAGIALTNRGEDFNAAFADLYPFATNVDVGARRAAPPGRRHQHAAARRRPGVLGAQPIAGRAPGVRAQQQRAVRGHGRPQRRSGRHHPGLPGIPGRDPVHDRSPDPVLADDQAADRRAPPRGRPADSGPAGHGPVGAGAAQPDDRHRAVDGGLQGRVPGGDQFLNASVPFLTRLTPYLGGLVPIIDYINAYRGEIAGFFANSTATTQGTLSAAYGGNQHYVRISNPINPELLTAYPMRPYEQPQ